MIAAILVPMAWPATSLAQTATGSAAPELAASNTIGHAAAKGVTLKVINGVAGLAVFSTGTGSLVAGGVLAAAVAASSFTVFVANDYIWDRFFPNTNLAANNQSFNAVWSVGRNTAKFLTFKPAVVAVDWSVIYLYTGSLASTLTMGPAYSILAPLTFYANNVAWDWYDWWSTPPTALRKR
jgi:uncharacterized membrane protein